MDTLPSYLPPALSDAAIFDLLDRLSLPRAQRIEPLQVTAAFHSIYLLHFSAGDGPHIPLATPEADGSIVLVLRVSGRHFPTIKTRNEAGVMEWVRRHTSIPVPAVIKFDCQDDNVLGHEYTILERVPGISIDKVYDGLDERQKLYLIEQLTDYLVQLHSQPWKHAYVGGLVQTDTGEIGEGPPMEETFWQLSDVEKYWADTPACQNPMSLNPLNVTNSWTSYIDQCLERYVFSIEMHPSLAGMRDLIPRIKGLRNAITTTFQKELDSVAYVLAHKDLHFANIMCDPSTLRITGILDWEFSSVVPAPRWNPVKAFLWNVQQTPESKPEKDRLYSIFEQTCASRGAQWLLDQVKMTPKQEAMSTAAIYIRTMIEYCVKGQALDKIPGWRKTAEESLAVLGV